MTLHAREFDAGGPPLVILHGMLGSSRNWSSVGKKLAEFSSPFALDLPNHGESPEVVGATVRDMADAVVHWMDANGVRQTALMGHSLGGKVAMRIASDMPERINRLFVLDIAPRAYPPDTSTLDAMLSLDVDSFTARSQADDALAAHGMNPMLRGFLLTNLIRTDEGFAWQVPLEIIRDQIPDWTQTPLESGDLFDGPTLFVAGGRSDYLSRSDFEVARGVFPNASLVVLPESGHNVHIEGGDAFVHAVRSAMEAG